MADDIKLGEIIAGRADRDAVHIVVVPLEILDMEYECSSSKCG